MNYDEILEGIIKRVSKMKSLTLATSFNDEVTASMMHFVNIGLDFYIQTDKKFEKYFNISKNENVGCSFADIYFKGKAEIIGLPKDFEEYLKIHKEKNPYSYETYTFYEDERLIKIRPTKIRIYIFDEDEHILELDTIEKTVRRIECYSIKRPE